MKLRSYFVKKNFEDIDIFAACTRIINFFCNNFRYLPRKSYKGTLFAFYV